ncbi:MAG: acyl-CoA thioesterase [Bacilli bacterium]|nr:acyl-CoA thioesterase [Bacilli bacterium]
MNLGRRLSREKMNIYKHKIQYYETDKMGIVHHSNYVKWMEEARIAYLSALNLDYASLEDKGVISPVIGINCKYKKPTKFGEAVLIESRLKEYNGIKLVFEYSMKNEAGEVVCLGESEHCFLSDKGAILIIKNSYPEIHEILQKEAENK